MGLSLIGAMVKVAYDPMATEMLMIHYRDMVPFTSRPLDIGAFCKAMPKLPEHLLPKTLTSSRFLDALEKKYEEK